MNAPPKPITAADASACMEEWRDLRNQALLEAVLLGPLRGRVAVISSFGAESAVLLDLVARIEPATPVIFIDTGRLFGETLSYRDRLADHLGLVDVRTVRAARPSVRRADPEGTLYRADADACCHLRKVIPYVRAVDGFDVLITGRKRHHGGQRGGLETVQRVGRMIRVNPLAHWTESEIDAAFERHALPLHPLVFAGYASIGCTVCTRPRQPGEHMREGRWMSTAKTECGIHMAVQGKGATPEPVSKGDHRFHRLPKTGIETAP